MNNNNTENTTKTNINWYPGHMAKTKRQIKETLDLIDIVYEIIDARIPSSSKIKDIDDIIKNKPKILIMTKTDLCDPNITDKWVSYYKNKGYVVLKLNLLKDNVNTIISKTNELLKHINDNRTNKGLKSRIYRALVIGIPNVGKSTLINKLVGKRATNVGNKPGITKNLSWIRINKDIELLDSPGILWPKFDNNTIAFNLASFSAIKEEILPLEDVTKYILETIYKYYPNLLKSRYNLDNVDDILKSYETIGRKRGCLIKGNIVDYDKVYNIIIRDLIDGNIGKITFDRI